jgi:alpha-tubulin suppressor-like RCC1 family protein
VTRGLAASALGLALVALVALGLALGAGCQGPSAFPCSSSAQCVSGGEQGTCADGYCAFPDQSCPGGMRYEPNAGDGRGGTCAGMPDAGPCGGVGQACCALEGAGCGDQAHCNNGMCAACISDLAFGRRFSCLVAHDGTVRCAGENVKGQLGFGIAGVPSATRMQARDSTSDPITDAVAVGAGREHACAVRAGGAVWCWGANESGQLGNNLPLPVPPAPPLPPRPAAVAVVKSDGTPLTGIVQVAGGYDFTCARGATGDVWCWGQNAGGQLGDGMTTSRSTAAPVLEGGAPLTGALDLQVGGSMSCVRKAGDAVWCWGRNGDGQFGDGTKTNHPSPIMLATTTSVALGLWHSCFLEADGTILCAGWNGHARLGIGTGSGYSDGDHTSKEKVLSVKGGAPFTGAKAVVAGGVTCALMQDSGVYCWGDNHYGQSGTGQGEAVPAKVRTADGESLTGVERLIAGYTHVCAIKTGGEVLCWGRNNDGDLGTGAFGNRGFPERIESACR